MGKQVIEVLGSVYKPTENLKMGKDIKPVFIDVLTTAKVISNVENTSGM